MVYLYHVEKETGELSVYLLDDFAYVSPLSHPSIDLKMVLNHKLNSCIINWCWFSLTSKEQETQLSINVYFNLFSWLLLSNGKKLILKKTGYLRIILQLFFFSGFILWASVYDGYPSNEIFLFWKFLWRFEFFVTTLLLLWLSLKPRGNPFWASATTEYFIVEIN